MRDAGAGMAIHRDSTERADKRYLKMLRSHMKVCEIAKKYGVSQAVISAIKHGTAWVHVL
jgi:uncharacterized protein YjcR